MFKRKLVEWLRRYLPAELSGTLGALIVALIARSVTKNTVVISYAGTWGENLGFYGYAIVREVRANRRSVTARRSLSVVIWRTVRNLTIEFGPAECADSFLVRPLCMLVGQRETGNLVAGIFSGKVAADVLFYLIAILFYELRKRWFRE